MATYYVRTDGNDGNTGLGSGTGQAWATIGKALGGTGITGGDTVYIAPGTYREVVTIAGTYSSATYVYGNPTASLFTGVLAGEVRITPSGSDNAVSTSYALTATSKNNLNFRDLIIGGLFLTNCSNTVVERCLCFSTSATTEAFYFNATTLANFNTTLKQSIFTGTVYGIRYGFIQSSSQYTTGLSVTDCYISGNSAVWLNGSTNFLAFPAGGLTFYNCVMSGAIPFLWSSPGITGSSSGNNIAVYNSLIYATGTYAFQNANSSVGIIENYNRIYGVNTRLAVSQGANTNVASWSGLEFGQSLLQGYGPIQIFGNTFNSPNATAGTASGAPAVDMYNQSWNVTPDIGVAIYRTIGGVGAYQPASQASGTITIAPGSTSQSVELFLGATGLTASTTGLSARYNRTRTASVSIPLVARTIAQAWTSGGFAEVDATNMPGVYRLDLPDAAVAAGADDVTVVVRGAAGTNGAVMTIKLSSGGLTAAQTTSAVWDATASAYNTAGSMGEAGQKLTGYSLASSQAFNNSGSIGSVTGAVGSVTGAVTVGTNNDKTGYALSTGGVSAVAGKVWDEPYTSHTTASTFGARTLLTTADNRPADVGTSNHIQANVHAIVDSTAAASELSGALLHNGTDYISAELVTPISTASLIYMGPFQVIADGVTTPQPLDIQKGTQQGIGIQLVDNNFAGISITGATITTKVYNSGGTLVATYSGTATYAADGRAQFTITTTVTNTPGTYTATITRTTGASDTQVFGPLRIYVRDI